MAPEQVGGSRGELTPRIDVYALGLIAFELLCAICRTGSALPRPGESRASFGARRELGWRVRAADLCEGFDGRGDRLLLGAGRAEVWLIDPGLQADSE